MRSRIDIRRRFGSGIGRREGEEGEGGGGGGEGGGEEGEERGGGGEHSAIDTPSALCLSLSLPHLFLQRENVWLNDQKLALKNIYIFLVFFICIAITKIL